MASANVCPYLFVIYKSPLSCTLPDLNSMPCAVHHKIDGAVPFLPTLHLILPWHKNPYINKTLHQHIQRHFCAIPMVTWLCCIKCAGQFATASNQLVSKSFWCVRALNCLLTNGTGARIYTGVTHLIHEACINQ